MNEITIEYQTGNGDTREERFTSDVIWLDLSNRFIRSIDLSPLDSCFRLAGLNLEENVALEKIDLGPLSSCTNLKRLNLYWNKLEVLDISPLSSCNKLEYLNLGHNELRTIDLTSLSSCPNFIELRLNQNNLKSINLTPLSSCSNLEHLDLFWNQLRTIDINPLETCSELKQLKLHMNHLRTIDLSALASCNQLRELWLGSNQLRHLDISPLANCTLLKELHLSENNLGTIDLTALVSCSWLVRLKLIGCNLTEINLSPLRNCTKLRELWLTGNQLHTIDITPLISCTRLRGLNIHGNKRRLVGVSLFSRETMENQLPSTFKQVHFGAAHPIRGLELIRKVVPFVREENTPWKMMHLAQCLAGTVCPDEIGLVEMGESTFRQLLEMTETPRIRERIIELLCEQIDRGGTTIGIDVAGLINGRFGELAKSVPRILELRKQELDAIGETSEEGLSKIYLLVIGGDSRLDYFKVDLRPLWLTAYGFRILSTLGLGLTCNRLLDRNQLVAAFQDIGYKISYTRQDSLANDSPRISEPMKEYIWKLAKYQKRRSN